MKRHALVWLIALSTPSGFAESTTPPQSRTAAPYMVQGGNKVDPQTLQGWKTWRALACERCHGAEQEGLVGPALVQSLKTLSREDFQTVVLNGRPEKGMPPFNTSPMVTQNWQSLYAYLKGRSDGRIQPGHLFAIDSTKEDHP